MFNVALLLVDDKIQSAHIKLLSLYSDFKMGILEK